MKKISLLILSLVMLIISACSDSSNPTATPTTPTTVQAYTLPESIDAIMPGTTATQSNILNINFNLKPTDVEQTCEATGKGAYASAKTEVRYENQEVLLPFEIINFLLDVLKNGNYASHLNDGTSVTASSYEFGNLTTAKFKVSRETNSDTMVVKMTFTRSNNDKFWVLMKVTKSVSTDLPYGEFEAHMYTENSSDGWQLGMKVSKGLILCKQNGGECPNKMRMELISAKVGKAYFWQDEIKLSNGKEKKSYFGFNTSNFFEYRIRTDNNNSEGKKYIAQDRNTTINNGSDFKLYNSDGSLYTGNFDGFSFGELTVSYKDNVLTSTQWGKYFYMKNGTKVKDYYAKATKIEVGFKSISSTNEEILAKVDQTMTYDSDFAYKSFSITDWGL